MSIPARLAKARALHDWDMSELARRIGVKPQTLSAIERGETKHMRADTAVAISLATGVTVTWLVTGRPPMMRADFNRPYAQELFGLLDLMTPDEQNMLLSIARATAGNRKEKPGKGGLSLV